MPGARRHGVLIWMCACNAVPNSWWQAQLWCGVDRSMSAWLATPEVIEALHVKSPKGTEKNNLHYTGVRQL